MGAIALSLAMIYSNSSGIMAPSSVDERADIAALMNKIQQNVWRFFMPGMPIGSCHGV
jgi:hypothetical protein